MLDHDTNAEADESADRQRYRAPALDKGLDILELLAKAPGGLSLAEIVQRLGRSHGELFRMVQVLQYREYIEQPDDGRYRLTDKLFLLGMEQPKSKSLIEVALPVMRALALDLKQSCHLAFYSGGEMVVVARMESGEKIGFAVRVGYRRPVLDTCAGLAVLAFQPVEIRDDWLNAVKPRIPDEQRKKLIVELSEIAFQGYASRPSSLINAVRDISAPIMRGRRAAATLTVPYLLGNGLANDVERATAGLVAAAKEISDQLIDSDDRA